MTIEPPTPEPKAVPAYTELEELRRFAGPPKEFWPRLLACLAKLCSANHAVLLVREGGPETGWKKIGEWPPQAGPTALRATFLSQMEKTAESCQLNGPMLLPLDARPARGHGNYILAARLHLQRPTDQCVAACLLSEVGEATAQEGRLHLSHALDTPALYQAQLTLAQARTDVEKITAALDAGLLVNGEKRFLAAALAFCNGLATKFHCERVSLGWLEGGYIRLRAISRTEKFDRQMGAARALEMAMEEAIDQDDEVVWPAPEGATVVTRDHERFSKDQGVAHLCSTPLHIEEQPVAVLTCERQGAPFFPLELQQLRLCCDVAARRLADLRHHDRWFGARWAATAREHLAKLLSPEHTWAKLLAVAIVAALAVLFFFKINYRVEGNFLLRSDDVTYLTAPFDGYIDQALVRPGDHVEAGAKLLTLQTAELEVEASAALADLNRYQREAEKARAAKALAEMRIAEAMAEESQARLDLIRFRIREAALKTPFAGVVIEGDLRERLGAPVKQADVLLKVARLDTLYVEAEVNERDVHEILGKSKGEMAFVSQPKQKFPIRIVTIEQAAVPKDQANVFLVRCAIEGGAQPWWRPGMSGVCKFQVEKRSLFWIFTHRTVDFLRLKLWW